MGPFIVPYAELYITSQIEALKELYSDKPGLVIEYGLSALRSQRPHYRQLRALRLLRILR